MLVYMLLNSIHKIHFSMWKVDDWYLLYRVNIDVKDQVINIKKMTKVNFLFFVV